MAIFSMLFGAGIILFTQRVEARGGRSGRRWFSRQGWLWLIGLLHGYLLWNGDILLPYALVAGVPAVQIGWVCPCGERLTESGECGCELGFRLPGG